MSTQPTDAALKAALATIPRQFRERLLKRYIAVKKAFVEGRHDECGVQAGKFSEVLIRFLQEHVTGTFTPFGGRLPAFDAECSRIQQQPRASGSESVRIVIPRALNFLYTVRNKRAMGHEGGDVDASEIDAATCVRLADWCMCELIAEFHSLPLEDAQDLLDTIALRETPEVWEVFGRKRVLATSLTKKQETLLLLYTEPKLSVLSEDLCSWVEYSSLAGFRRHVLSPLHKARRLEYDSRDEMVAILPPGIAEVENIILPKIRDTQ